MTANGTPRILAVEPFYGGSHKAFLDQLSTLSRHSWDLITLPGRSWRWRMRHAGYTCSDLMGPPWATPPQLLFCSSMLNLPDFLGFRPELASCEAIVYFHENQFTYPLAAGEYRDYHCAWSQVLSVLRARESWFNSAYHLKSFFSAAESWLRKMPDFQPMERLQEKRACARVMYPGILIPETNKAPSRRPPVRILWAARMEHDKRFDRFMNAIHGLEQSGLDFRLRVVSRIPENPDATVSAFTQKVAHRIEHWGYVENRDDYLQCLSESDLIVSTADHEFYGLSVMEAVAMGCYPLLPYNLAYPELFDPDKNRKYFYATPEELGDRLLSLLRKFSPADLHERARPAQRIALSHTWSKRIDAYDEAFTQIMG